MAGYIELKSDAFKKIKAICIEAYSQDVIELSKLSTKIMDMEEIPMHHPYHHFIVPAVLLVATLKQTKGSMEDLEEMLNLAEERSRNILGGFCGSHGACGAGIGAGIFMSIFTDNSPLSEESWQWSNEVTGRCLQEIATTQGPRCCKRTTFMALQVAAKYLSDNLHIDLDLDEKIKCKYSSINRECKKNQCPFYKD